MPQTRAKLKTYFVANAIPTAGNFAELIEAPLNQADDGIFKTGGDPLSVVAAPEGQRRVLRLYSSYPADNADWLLSLNPSDPADSTKSKAGLGFADGTGRTRLYIDPTSGSLGLGTVRPDDLLSLNNGDLRVSGGENRQLKVISDGGNTGLELVVRNQTKAGKPYIDFTHGDLNNPNYGVRVGADDNKTLTIEALNASVRLKLTGGLSTTEDVAATGAITTKQSVTADTGFITKATVAADGKVTAKGGLVVDGSPAAGIEHINSDGALYRHKDGQVYLTVDDNFYVRDTDGTVRAHFNTDNGTLKLTHSAGPGLALVGSNHSYVEFYPQGTDRFGWMGYGTPSGAGMAVCNTKGDLTLQGTRVIVSGELSAASGVAVGDGNLSTHIDKDGALYRCGGQVFLTVDDLLYIRDANNGAVPFTFNTEDGSLKLTLLKMSNDERPFHVVKVSLSGGNYNLGWSSSTYTAVVVGFKSSNGDIDEGGTKSNPIFVYCYASGGVWFVTADLASHGTHETWEVWVMRIHNNMLTSSGL